MRPGWAYRHGWDERWDASPVPLVRIRIIRRRGESRTSGGDHAAAGTASRPDLLKPFQIDRVSAVMCPAVRASGAHASGSGNLLMKASRAGIGGLDSAMALRLWGVISSMPSVAFRDETITRKSYTGSLLAAVRIRA